ncbi:protein serine/threonine phosphatase [Aureococcus anophagefferens]|nr:protein serine/threonine phosphatase [Aureococcus anophagefferens]
MGGAGLAQRPRRLSFLDDLDESQGVAGGGMGSATSARFQQEKQEGKEKRVHRPDDAAAAPEKRPRLAEDASTGGRLMRTFCGVAETIGKKRTMEDRSSVIQLADGASSSARRRRVVHRGAYRVFHESCPLLLAVSRSLGDFALKKHPGLISATPEVTDRSLKPGWDDFAIFATDGLWDVVSDADAVGIVYDTIGEALASGSVTQELCTEAASKCIQAARKRCTMDNVLVLVLCFQWRPKSGAAA